MKWVSRRCPQPSCKLRVRAQSPFVSRACDGGQTTLVRARARYPEEEPARPRLELAAPVDRSNAWHPNRGILPRRHSPRTGESQVKNIVRLLMAALVIAVLPAGLYAQG